eukprot:XP_800440.1 PREDICTED: uncharacterized protein LOC587241 [Strongylocentrotus purpuratus]
MSPCLCLSVNGMSLDLSPKPRQDTTRNTEQTTSSIREVKENHGSPTYQVLQSGTSSGKADAIKGNDFPNMTYILLLRCGDVELNPGPNDNLTELELYHLAEGMDPSDFRKVGLALGFSEAKLRWFEKDKLAGKSMEATYQMLYEWQKTVRESEAREILVKKLGSIELVQLADSVQKGGTTLDPQLEENMPKPKKEVQDRQVIQVQAYFPKYYVTEKRDREHQAGDCNDKEGVQNSVAEEDALEDLLELEGEIAVESGAISVPSRERIMMVKKKRGKEKEIKVKGKFLMDGPWWNASFKAVKEGDVYICQGIPTYTLRNKKGQKGEDLLQLLLKYVFRFPIPGRAEDQMKQAFWDYFEKWRGIKKRKDYTFCQFFKALEDALKKEPTPNDTTAIPMMQVAEVILQRFDPSNECFSHASSNTDEEEKKPKFDLRYVYRCFKCPLLFKGLPLLMEREAFSILSTEKLRDLQGLESVLAKSPEDLEFYMGTKEVFQGFVNAGMIPPNLFKCTTNQDSAPPLLSKSSSKKNCTLDQPSTSTANQDTDGPSTSKPKNKTVISRPILIEVDPRTRDKPAPGNFSSSNTGN